MNLKGQPKQVWITAFAAVAFAALMLVMAVPSKPLLVAAVIASGIVSGLLNTLFTGTAMSISDAPRPVASAGYNFLSWMGGAVAATFVTTKPVNEQLPVEAVPVGEPG